MAEKEYIEMEPVKRHIRHLIQDPWNHQAAPASWADAYRQMIDILDDEPVADVRPAKRGEWVCLGVSLDRETGEEYPMYFCSECGAMNYVGNQNFCYFCGADMRSVTDDGQ